MILIAGLGNPGEDYKKNRHNVGFLFIDYIAKKFGIDTKEFITKKKKCDYITFKYGEKEATLIKPLTFMNNSGEAILFMSAFLKVREDELLVVYDDIDLEFGEIRLKNKGSDAGHNGVKSVQQLLGRDGFTRLRIGIGRPKDRDGNDSTNREEIIKYVLGDFTLVEQFLLEHIVFKYAFEVIKGFIENGYEEAVKNLVKVKPIIKDELSKELTLPELE
jgi:PTH1 family peptidyl-tRNA hydrolase